jgi:hypothetical protein
MAQGECGKALCLVEACGIQPFSCLVFGQRKDGVELKVFHVSQATLDKNLLPLYQTTMCKLLEKSIAFDPSGDFFTNCQNRRNGVDRCGEPAMVVPTQSRAYLCRGCNTSFCKFSCQTHKAACSYQPRYKRPRLDSDADSDSEPDSGSDEDGDLRDSKRAGRKEAKQENDQRHTTEPFAKKRKRDDDKEAVDEEEEGEEEDDDSKRQLLEYEGSYITAPLHGTLDMNDPTVKFLLMMRGDELKGSSTIQQVLHRQAVERSVSGAESATQSSACACPFIFECKCDNTKHFGFFTCKDPAGACMCVFRREAKPDLQDRIRLNAYLKQHGMNSGIPTVVSKPRPTCENRPTDPCFIAKCGFCGTENGLYCGGLKGGPKPFHYMERLREYEHVASHLQTLRTWQPREHVNPFLFDNAFTTCVNELCSNLVVLNYADFFHGRVSNTVLCAKHREEGDTQGKSQRCVLVMERCYLFFSLHTSIIEKHILLDPCTYAICHGDKACGLEMDMKTARLNMKVYPIRNFLETKDTCERYHRLTSMESHCESLLSGNNKQGCSRCDTVKKSVIGEYCGSLRSHGRLYDPLRGQEGIRFYFPCSQLSLDNTGNAVLVEYIKKNGRYAPVSHRVDIKLYQCLRCLKHHNLQRRFCYGCLFRHSMTHDWSLRKKIEVVE